MRKALLFAPMLMLLLAACGGGEKDLAADIQSQYAALASATMEADVTCHYEDEVRDYTFLCAYAPESSTVTVLAPENLSGISATVADGTLTLSYDDISLDAGMYSAASISPVAALPRLMEAAASGYITEQSTEDLDGRKCLRLSCDLPGEEGTTYTTWFDEETLLPLHSEISADGTVVFDVAWSRFEVNQQAAAQSGGDTSNAGNTSDGADAAQAGGDQAAGTSDTADSLAAQDTWTAQDELDAYASAED